MTFHSVPGNRRGALLFTSDDGYYYNLRFSTGSKSHYTCHRTNCDARVWAYKDTAVAHRNDKFPWHSHDTEHCLEAVNVLRQTIISRVQRESLPPKRIFDEECNKVPTDISKHLAFGQIESNLQKSRRKFFPRLPNSPAEFNNILMSYEWQGRFSKTLNGKIFYRKNLVIKGKNNLVFLPENMERIFETAEEIHMDGTFKMFPSVPGLKQLFVVMAVSYNYAFPVCYILMDNRSYLSYKRIFAMVKDIVPQLNPKIIISDFKRAMMKASKEEFPDAVITGCWWHYANRILKKAKSLFGVHLLTRDDYVKKVMHMCMALPLLPQEKMEAGLAAVREIAIETAHGTVNNAFTLLFAYIQSQWIQKVGADHLTMCSLPRRTNNDSELFNMSLKREMGHAHPNAWAFVDGLKNIEDIQTTIFERIQNGLPIGRLRRRRFLSKEKVIKTAMQNLQAERITEREFLSTAAAFIGRKVNFQLQEDEDEEEDDDEEEENEDDEEEDEDEEEVDIPPSPSPAADAHASAAIGGELPRPAKRKKSIDPDEEKNTKTQNTSDGTVPSSSNQSSHIPECLGPDSELSPSIRNNDTNLHIEEEGIKDELMLEDYDNSDGAFEETYFEESENNENSIEDSNVYASTFTDARVPFETVVCDGGFQVKQEIVEDETGDFEMAHEPESVTTTLKSTGTVNTTEPTSSGYSENTREIDSLDELARLSNTLGTTSKPSQDTGTLGYTIPTDVQTVNPSQPLLIAATTPNYIGVIMSDSYAVTNYSAASAINYNMAATTNFSAAITTNYSADAAATNFHADISTPTSFTSLPANSATNPSPISATNTPSQPPRDESSSCPSDCEDLEGVLISLKKVPVERRTKTKDKLLRLVKLISELDLDPDEVSFSVTTK